MLHGPRQDWLYLKGEWGEPYNGTLAPDRLRGPAAFFERARFADAVIECRVRLRTGCELGALVLRARPAGEVLAGLQVVLDLDAGRVQLAFVAAEAQDEAVLAEARHEAVLAEARHEAVLAEAPGGLEPDQWQRLRVTLDGPRVRVSLDGKAVLDVTDARLEGEGGLGLRAMGEAFDLDEVTIRTADGVVTVPPDEVGSPAERALESLCLTLLNLNEFVYVD
ncbi:MAG: hypothetical protein O7B99_12490 [Planctomycetota bacterium]|nr:hypothetical protein [Planctomycetota bacterium]